ncbi:hypothetical protein M378DRAFT_58294, partial [Amanita muscaria Koide BX008]
KAVVIISILMQSNNERCNQLQTLLGVFFHSISVPERAVELLARAGLSVSVSTINNAISSLSKQASVILKSTVRTMTTAFAYDNFNMDFKTSEPTIEHSSSFISATSATAIPL